MENNNLSLDELIDIAYKDLVNIQKEKRIMSLVEKMEPYVRLNNLLLIKLQSQTDNNNNGK